MDIRRTLADFNAAAFWAGISTFIFMVFGALTLQISVIERFQLPESMTQSWIAITWITSALASLLFILRFRQPLGLGWTIPGLVYVGSLASRFSFEEIVTANLVAGCVIVVLGLVGAGERVIRIVPMPILMSMFAASMIDFITRMVDATSINLSLTVPMLAAYMLGRRLNIRQVPPVGLSVIIGAALIGLLGEWRGTAFTFGFPTLSIPGFALSPEALLTISVPMVILVVGLGNTQGLGYLISQGYGVPANRITTVVGLMTLLNGLFGGHPAAMTRTASAMLGGPSAGPLETRYWAALIAFILAMATGLASGFVVALVAILPPEYIVLVAGLAVLPSFEDALVRAFAGQFRFGSVVAFGVTLSGSLMLAGIPSAFWALIAGMAASMLVEGDELKAHWGFGIGPSKEPLYQEAVGGTVATAVSAAPNG